MKILLLILSFTLALPINSFSKESSSSEKAANFAEAGFSYYYFADYKKSSEFFVKAIKLSPQNKDYQLGYAKSLIKSGQSDKAITVLKALKLTKEKDVEKNYLLAISYYNQDDNKMAAEKFQEVVTANHGLKTSAEGYLKRISEEEQRYKVTASFGAMFDSRIIDEDLLTTTDGSGGRVFLGAGVDYRLKKTAKGQWNLRGEVANYYSLDDDLSIADPLMIAFRAPYNSQRSIMGNNFNVILQPSLEVYWLDIDSSGSRELFLTSLVFDMIAAKNINGNKLNAYYGTAQLDLGQAASLEDTDSDIDGINLLAGWKHTRLLKHGRLWQTDGYLKANFASGSDIKFYRLGVNYSYLLKYLNWNTGLVAEARYSIYPSNTDGSRNDKYLSGAAIATRSIADLIGNPDWNWLKLELRAGYALNLSTIDSKDYNRFILSSLVKGNWSF